MAGEMTLHQLMLAPVITRAVSRIKTPLSRFQNFYGLQMGGQRSVSVGGHHTGWDIFDQTRDIAPGRAPGTGPATMRLNPVGHVDARIYRAHGKTFILDERVFKTRPLGQPYGTVDSNGQRYITKQEGILAQKFKNSREFMISRAFRGGFDLLLDGDDCTPVDTGSGNLAIDFKIPAGNKLKLDMLGTGDIVADSWDDPATDIIGQLLSINAANEQLHGWPLRHAWCRSSMLSNLMANTGLIAAGGSANTVFDRWQPSGLTSEEGIEDTGFSYVPRGYPNIVFHAYDGVLNVNGTATPFIPANNVIFTPDPGDWIEVHEGSEPVRENKMSESREQMGFYAWSEPTTQPAGQELLGVDNAIPALLVPKAIQYATVVFG